MKQTLSKSKKIIVGLIILVIIVGAAVIFYAPQIGSTYSETDFAVKGSSCGGLNQPCCLKGTTPCSSPLLTCKTTTTSKAKICVLSDCGRDGQKCCANNYCATPAKCRVATQMCYKPTATVKPTATPKPYCNATTAETDFTTKGIIYSNLYPNGKEDYCYNFSGKTYLMKGFCDSSNNYGYIQKNCAELGANYACKEGKCTSTTPTVTVTPTPTSTATPTPVPTAPPADFEMYNYIEDNLDWNAQANDWDARNNSYYNQPPVFPADTSYSSQPGVKYSAKKITSVETPLLFSGTITDEVASKSYSEEEQIYLLTTPTWVESAKQIQSTPPQMAYYVKFANPIPFCTNINPDGSCAEADLTKNHNVKIRFLGQDWTIDNFEGYNQQNASMNTKLTLRYGTTKIVLNGIGNLDTTSNKYWQVNLELAKTSTSSLVGDSLRGIKLTKTVSTNYLDGGYETIPAYPSAFKFKYDGLTLNYYQTISFDVFKGTMYFPQNSSDATTQLTHGIKVSGPSNAFALPYNINTKLDAFYLGTVPDSQNMLPLYYLKADGFFGKQSIPANGYAQYVIAPGNLQLHLNLSMNYSELMQLNLIEPITANNYSAFGYFRVLVISPSSPTDIAITSAGGIESVNYAYSTPGALKSLIFNAGYITPRGSIFKSVTPTSITIDYATALRYAIYTLGAG